MGLIIHVYLEDFHDIANPPSVKIYPLMDFESLVPIFNWHYYTFQVL
jgi:hypothetical protein